MIINNEDIQRKHRDSPRFGQRLTSKRIHSFVDEQKATSISDPPKTLILLRKLSEDGIRASVLKGKLNTLSKSANHHHKNIDNFICTVTERCYPVFDILSDLSESLNRDCLFSFPLVRKALDGLTQSALGVSRVLEQLKQREEKTKAENTKLQTDIISLRQSTTEKKQENKELEDIIISVKKNIEEKQKSCSYVNSTSNPIEERAQQRRELCLELKKEYQNKQTTNNKIINIICCMQKKQEIWLSEQKNSLDKLNQDITNCIKLQENTKEKRINIEEERKDREKKYKKEEYKFALLQTQVDSQIFCVELLLSRIRNIEEETKEIYQTYDSVKNEKEECARNIEESEVQLPALLSLIEAREIALREETRKIRNKEEMHTNLLQQTSSLKKNIFNLQSKIQTTNVSLLSVQEKIKKIEEEKQEKENQIFMFAEDVCLSYQTENAHEAGAAAAREAADRLSSLRSALSATLQMEEKAKEKRAETEEKCVSLEKSIERTRQELSRQEDKHCRDNLISTLKTTNDKIKEDIADTKKKIKEINEEMKAEEEKLKKSENAERETELEKEKQTWSCLMNELKQTNSKKRKEIAGEELSICDDNFRMQIQQLRRQHEEEMKKYKQQLEELKEKEIKRKATKLGEEEEDAENQNFYFNSTHPNNSNSCRKKALCRRLVGHTDISSASLSTPHLHALKEKLAMNIHKGSSKTRRDILEAGRCGVSGVCADSQDVESQTRSTKGQKTGRRSNGGNTFDIFLQHNHFV